MSINNRAVDDFPLEQHENYNYSSRPQSWVRLEKSKFLALLAGSKQVIIEWNFRICRENKKIIVWKVRKKNTHFLYFTKLRIATAAVVDWGKWKINMMCETQ